MGMLGDPGEPGRPGDKVNNALLLSASSKHCTITKKSSNWHHP